MDNLLQSIGNFGFPMVISAYLLVRIEVKMEQLARNVTEMSALAQAARIRCNHLPERDKIINSG